MSYSTSCPPYEMLLIQIAICNSLFRTTEVPKFIASTLPLLPQHNRAATGQHTLKGIPQVSQRGQQDGLTERPSSPALFCSDKGEELPGSSPKITGQVANQRFHASLCLLPAAEYNQFYQSTKRPIALAYKTEISDRYSSPKQHQRFKCSYETWAFSGQDNNYQLVMYVKNFQSHK